MADEDQAPELREFALAARKPQKTMQDLGIYLTQPGASHAPVLDALRALSASQFHELARDIELWAGRLQHEETQEWDRIHLHPQSRERES